MTETLTFCFTDIEGSTRMLASLGPDAYEQVQDRMRAILRTSWGAHGGVEVRAEGDGGFVAFTSPSAAVMSCVESQHALQRRRGDRAVRSDRPVARDRR